ncbi:hypothetical protein FRZ44_04800 [Hypericibacter terrae]|uniref:Uncharacterized protein n=2 Tax=Hypericibacter terrae TaxID=2602015 RepID=A0A5J6MG29_9PROT|nr:hypothetical protein FRZ44_04800 [Hypericibacter terrae]
MVVDSDLGNIDAYNQRKKPIDGAEFLPTMVTLVYASGDVGKDSIVNRSLSIADSVATQCLDGVESGAVPFNLKIIDCPWFQGLRIINPNRITT